MSTLDRAWSYSLSVEESQRLPPLLEQHMFAQIANRIATEMCVLCCHRSKMSDADFYRPVYTVQLDRELFDLFFNSSNGYRGAYFQSPGTGLDANAYLMQAIAPRLGNQVNMSIGCAIWHQTFGLVALRPSLTNGK